MRRETILLLAIIVIVAPLAGVTTYFVLESFFLRAATVPFPGELSLDILQNEPYARLVVEVDWVRGQEPDAVALSTLEARLETYSLKESVEVVLSGEVEVNITSFTPRDLFNLERSFRDLQTSGDTLVIYLLYVPGALKDSRNSLAVTYLGGSVAVFKEVIERVARQAPGVSARDIETSALIHELGHLFGLVNIVYQSDLDYEDPEHPFHSLNRSCVMFWAIELGAVVAEKPPTDFGFEARYDIERLRRGEYETFPSRLRETEASAQAPLPWLLDPNPEGAAPIFLCRVEVALQPEPWQRVSC